MNTALILTGGGARAAYQVGALLGLKDICETHNIKFPFNIYSGCSAGAVNTAFLANAHDLEFRSFSILERLWRSIHTSDIYKSDIKSFLSLTKKLLWNSIRRRESHLDFSNGLLDSSPLKTLIDDHYDEKKVQQHIDSGKLKGFGLSVFNYSQNISEYFFQSDDSVKEWRSKHRIGTKSSISSAHIHASSSIPLIFPYVAVGDDYYGDGSLRNYKPMNPSLHLGADKLFVIGVLDDNHKHEHVEPSASKVLSTVLNSILLDSTELEAHYINKFNELIVKSGSSDTNMKFIDIFSMKPSVDIGEVAIEMSDDLPKVLKHLILGLGKKKEGGDLISYLLFEPKFIKRLIQIGKQDALDQKEEILNFLT